MKQPPPEHDPEHSQLLRGLHDDAPIAAESTEAREARRARVVPTLEMLIAESGVERQRRRRFVYWGACAAALAAVIAVSGRSLLSPPAGERAEHAVPTTSIASTEVVPPNLDEEKQAPALEQGTIARGTKVQTLADESSVTLTNGAVVFVGRETSVVLSDTDPRASELKLGRGRVRLEVPPLASGAKLAVVTDVGSVVVHGTKFSVETGQRADGPWMLVEVEEGEVAVHQNGVERARLHKGEAWRSTKLPAVAPPAAMVAASAASDLDAQNAAYASAMKLKASGNDLAAVAKLEQLLARWPSSPLAPEARAELARAKKRLR